MQRLFIKASSEVRCVFTVVLDNHGRLAPIPAVCMLLICPALLRITGKRLGLACDNTWDYSRVEVNSKTAFASSEAGSIGVLVALLHVLQYRVFPKRGGLMSSCWHLTNCPVGFLLDVYAAN